MSDVRGVGAPAGAGLVAGGALGAAGGAAFAKYTGEAWSSPAIRWGALHTGIGGAAAGLASGLVTGHLQQKGAGDGWSGAAGVGAGVAAAAVAAIAVGMFYANKGGDTTGALGPLVEAAMGGLVGTAAGTTAGFIAS